MSLSGTNNCILSSNIYCLIVPGLCGRYLAGIPRQGVRTVHVVPGVADELNTVLALELALLRLAGLPRGVGDTVGGVHPIGSSCFSEASSVREGVGPLGGAGHSSQLVWTLTCRLVPATVVQQLCFVC